MKTGNSGKRPNVIRAESSVSLEKFRKPLREYLTSGLEHPDKWVRYMAAEMLGALGDTGAIGDLMPLVACEDSDIRAAALRSVERIGDYRITGPSAQATNCNSCLIRSIAEEALVQLKNRNSGPGS
jgi:HEAT repeat protein